MKKKAQVPGYNPQSYISLLILVIGVTMIVYILSIGLQIEKYFPDSWKREKIIIKLITIFKSVWRDILIYLTI